MGREKDNRYSRLSPSHSPAGRAPAGAGALLGAIAALRVAMIPHSAHSGSDQRKRLIPIKMGIEIRCLHVLNPANSLPFLRQFQRTYATNESKLLRWLAGDRRA
jgi:hypothetical protein